MSKIVKKRGQRVFDPSETASNQRFCCPRFCPRFLIFAICPRFFQKFYNLFKNIFNFVHDFCGQNKKRGQKRGQNLANFRPQNPLHFAPFGRFLPFLHLHKCSIPSNMSRL